MNRASLNWLARIARHVAGFLSDPHDEPDRYEVTRMTREEWEEYEKTRYEEECEKEAKK